MRATALQHLGLIAIAAIIAGVVSVTLGSDWGWMLFSIVVLALLFHQLRQLSLLHRWVSAKGNEPVPESSGIWDEIFAKMYRHNRDQIRARGRFARLLARSMQAGRALPYGVAILDHDWRIVWCNDAAEAHFSVSLSADAGQVFTNLVRQPEFIQYVNAGDYAEPLELNTARTDGLVLAIQMVPFVEAQHMLLSRDVTESHKLSMMRRDFVANVSHELRTPLTVMVGFLETVLELKLDAARLRDYLNLMSVQSRRMQSIINDLLTLSALESAPLPHSDEIVDLDALLAQVRNEAEQLSAGRHRITLIADNGAQIAGNTSEITSAFTNLANNAVRYTPENGEIGLSWSTGPQGGAFSVTDNGPGIEAEHLPRLTERFYRVDRSRSRETGGTGLGLAIVKHALARHQATLEIESQIDKGSRFTARFPASRLVAMKSERAALA